MCWVLLVARLQPREADTQGPGLTCGPHYAGGRQSITKQTSLGPGNGGSRQVMKLESGGGGREGRRGRLQTRSPSWGDLVNGLFQMVESSSHTFSHSSCPLIYPSTAFFPAFFHLLVPSMKQLGLLEKIVWDQTGLGFPGSSDSKESACNVGELGSIPGLGRFPGGRHGNPSRYSFLENPRDRGAWWATVHGVTKTEIQLSDQAQHRGLSSDDNFAVQKPNDWRK